MVVKYTPEAKRNLTAIMEYYSSKGYPNSARKHTATITSSISKLKTAPNMGMSFHEKFGVESDLQFIVTDKVYLVIYRICDDAIEITHIIDGRTDYIHWLFSAD